MQRQRSSGCHSAVSRLGALTVTFMVLIGATMALTPLTAAAASAPTISITGLTPAGDVFSDVATFSTVYSLSTVGSDDPTATYVAQSTTPGVCSADIVAGVTFLSTGDCVVELTATPGTGSSYINPGTAELDIAVSPATTVISVNGTPDTSTLSDNATYSTPYPISFTTSDPTTSVAATFDTTSPSVCPTTVASPLVFTGVGQCVIDLSSTDASGNYTSPSATYTITVGPATPVISVNGAPDIGNLTGTGTYGTPFFLPTFATNDSSATFTPTFDTSSPSVCPATVTSPLIFTGFGQCVIDLTSIDASGDYTSSSVSYTIIVSPATAVISVNGTPDTTTLSDNATYATPYAISFTTSDPTTSVAATFDTSSPSVCPATVTSPLIFTGFGQCVIDLTSIDASGDYTSSSVSYTIIVGPATTVISVGGLPDSGNLSGTGTFGTSPTLPNFTTSDPTTLVVATFDPSSSAVCSGSVGDSVTFTGVGQCVIDLTSTDTSGDYTNLSVKFTLTVGPATPVISVGGVTDPGNLAGTATYGTSLSLPSLATTDSSGTVTPKFDPSSSAVCSGSVGDSVTFTGVGQCVIDLTSTDTSGDYTNLSVKFTLTVGPATSSIDVGGVTDTGNLAGTATVGTVYQVPAITTNVPSVTVNATFAPSSSAVCSGSVGTTIDFTGAGTCVIDLASSSANPNFKGTTATFTITISLPIQVAQATLRIDPGQVTLVTHDVNLSTTGGSGSGLVTYKVVGGTAKGCVITGSTSYSLSAKSAGTCVVRATKASDVNYLVATSALVVFRFQAPEKFVVLAATGGVHSGATNVVNIRGTGLANARILSASGATASIVTRNLHTLKVDLILAGNAKPGRYHFIIGTSAATRHAVYFNLAVKSGSKALVGHVSLKPQVLVTKEAQAALSIVAARAHVGTSLVLHTSGGSGTGTLTFHLVGGTAKGCALYGAASKYVHSAGAGTCVVVADKAGDTNHRSTSSTPATFTFVAKARPKSAFVVTSVSGTLSAGATSNIELRGHDFLAGGKVTVSSAAFTWHVVSGDTTELTIQLDVAAKIAPGVYVLMLESKAGGTASVYLVMSKSASGHVSGLATLTR